MPISRSSLTWMPAVLLATLGLGCAQANLEEDPRFTAFAETMAERHDFDTAEVLDLLARSERQQDIIDALDRPAERMPWHRYRPIFLQDSRIEQGVAFWNRHYALLRRAEAEFGVPPEIIVAVIGVETRYGQHKGRHRVLDALRTMAFDYPSRATFGQNELEAFLVLSREEDIDPLRAQGSYAGAMGMPQFISSSYRAYAVDFSGDGRRDLFASTEDAVGSVANYFAEHGWESDAPVTSPARVTGEAWRELLGGGLRPNTTVGELRAAGVTPEHDYPDETPARLLELEGEAGLEYWVTLDNFYVITRYNHSALYAMAVHQLGRAITESRGSTR